MIAQICKRSADHLQHLGTWDSLTGYKYVLAIVNEHILQDKILCKAREAPAKPYFETLRKILG